MASQRRLITDHTSLRRSPLPPNYLFPDDSSSSPDDLSQLTVLLTGSEGTPYSQGLWRLHLKIPEDYPRTPPKATFKTRIFHPNVDETTGAVCVETLKRDWDPKLTLRDVLITISCLLVQPNPDSALNATAGSLIQEDYDDFSRQARLMASIHAPIPSTMREAVGEARLRGEDANTRALRTESQERPTTSRATSTSSSSVVMKRKAISNSISRTTSMNAATPIEDEEEEEEIHDPSKENDPSLSPSPVTPPAPLSPRKSALRKRPLSDLPTPTEPEDEEGMTASQRNVSANVTPHSLKEQDDVEFPLKKSPKLTELNGKGVNASGRYREDMNADSKLVLPTEEEKENLDKRKSKNTERQLPGPHQSTSQSEMAATKAVPGRPALRKTSTASSSSSNKTTKARVGIRRL